MKALALALKENLTLKDFHLKCDYQSDYDNADKAIETLETIRLRNERLPNNITEIISNIAEKIYQSFEQKKQGHIDTSKQFSLESTESSLIATFPNACIKILEQLIKKDGISKEDVEALYNHVKKFDGTGVSGSRILISSLESKELESFFNLKERLSLTELFSATGVTKNLGSGEVEGRLPSNLHEMSKDGLIEIYKHLRGENKTPNPPCPVSHSRLSNDTPYNSRY